uniref:EGF-like domain-containing protein n=1 Tax=Nothoprocta perdicaria TaxID=30464 RepID=A0A8C6YMZ9_NOTPE
MLQPPLLLQPSLEHHSVRQGRPRPPCQPGEFACKNNRCIQERWKCDGDNDCLDNSDEAPELCRSLACKAPSHPCANSTSVCLPPEKLCDGTDDCGDGSDEGELCGEHQCSLNNGGCSHNCSVAPGEGIVCSCPLGMELGADNRTCQIQSYCAKHLKCSQKCEQDKYNVKCSCYEGWMLEADGESCRNPFKPFIIFSNRHEIRRIDLQRGDYSVLVPGLRNTIALDFHLNQSSLYWTDVVEDKIYRGKLFEVVIQYGLATPEGLAVDWIAGNIYWVESNLDQIEVAKLDGTMRTTLLAGDIEHPRAIALDPRYGILFWTDWDASLPRIEAASMSGLYWCDARTDKIERIDLESGENREVVLASNNMDMFSVSVFEDYIYWSDRYGAARRWEGGPRTGPGGDGGSAAPWSRSTHANGSIKRGSKDNATESVSLRTGIGVQLKDIKVFNRARQKGRDERSDAAVPAATRCARKAQGTNGPLCPHERATSCAG